VAQNTAEVTAVMAVVELLRMRILKRCAARLARRDLHEKPDLILGQAIPGGAMDNAIAVASFVARRGACLAFPAPRLQPVLASILAMEVTDRLDFTAA
jgi:hypothetical protein